MRQHKSITGKLSAGVLAIGTCVAAQAPPVAASAGIVNATSGTVTVNGTDVSATASSATTGAASLTTVASGETLTTGGNGHAEVLLSPGVFLRVGPDSAITMLSSALNAPEVRIVKGQALVEASSAVKTSEVVIANGGSMTRLEKPGLYGFEASASQATSSVFDGKATVERGGKHAELNAGHEVEFANGLHATKFDTKAARRTDLYTWSEGRSQVESAANLATARNLKNSRKILGGAKAGWVFNPAAHAYTLLPSDGEAFSAFGYAFVAPKAVAEAAVMRMPVNGALQQVPVNPLNLPAAAGSTPQLLTAAGQPWQSGLGLAGEATARANAAAGVGATAGSTAASATGAIASAAGASGGLHLGH